MIKKCFLLLFICLNALFSFATGTISQNLTGVVVDKATGDPVIGATIVLKGKSQISTSTDLSGRFSFDKYSKDDVIQIYSIGYKTFNSPLNTLITDDLSKSIVVEMIQDHLFLDAVVVTGQGAAIEKKRVSSNIVSISEKQIENLNNSRIDNMLQNALPNVQITLTNGQPGTTSMFKSRGLNSAFTNATPVIYIDGVRVDNLNTISALSGGSSQGAASGALADLPVENIERIEYVTGGAATTLFGSDAANGVIQIFTKKRGDGDISFNIETQAGVDIPNSQFYYFKNTKDLLQQTGVSQRYRLAINGSSQTSGFSLVTGMSHSQGTVINNQNYNKKYDLSLGVNQKLKYTIEYNGSFSYVYNEYGRSRNGNQGGFTGLWFTEGVASSNFGFNPDIDNLSKEEYAAVKEFVRKAEKLQDNSISVNRFQTSHSFTATPFKNTTLKALIGLDYRESSDKNIVTNEYLIHTRVKPEGTHDAGSITTYNRNYFGLTSEFSAQHKQYWNNVSLYSIAGFQFFSNNDQQIMYSGSNVRDGAQTINGAGVSSSNDVLQYLHNYGFFVQENLGIYDKLFLELGLRTDYNTAFGDNVGWQIYPKIGISFSLDNENFMQNLKQKELINAFKIRANYGVAGNFPPPFEYQKTVNFNPYLGGQAAGFGRYGNPDLGPEKTYAYEVGFDISMLKRFLNIGATYYHSVTKDALFNVPAAPSTGYDSYLANVGEILNRGLELYLKIDAINNKTWGLNGSFSVNTNHNEVLSMSGLAPFAIGGMSARTIQNVVEEGMPIGFLRGSKTELNPDGSIKETNSLQNLGSVIPETYGNMALNVRYKKLNLNITGDYQIGAYVHSFDRQFRFMKDFKDPSVPDKALEGTTAAKQVWNFTNFFVEKADFLKIRNIGLAYRIDTKGVINRVNLSIDIYNPFSITSSSVDPESVLSGARSQGAVAPGGLNYSTYSTPRQIIGAIKVTF